MCEGELDIPILRDLGFSEQDLALIMRASSNPELCSFFHALTDFFDSECRKFSV